jgi:hypothetical protein
MAALPKALGDELQDVPLALGQPGPSSAMANVSQPFSMPSSTRPGANVSEDVQARRDEVTGGITGNGQ